jgi:hypothetical protein
MKAQKPVEAGSQNRSLFPKAKPDLLLVFFAETFTQVS